MQDLMSELRGETSRDNQSTNQNAPDSNTVTNQTRSSQAERKRSLRKVFKIGCFQVAFDIMDHKFLLKTEKKIKYRNQFGTT